MGIEKAKEELVEWITSHIKNRDIMTRSLESIDKNKKGFDVYAKFKDKEQFIFAVPIIEGMNDILAKMEDKGAYYTVITFNNLKNLKAIINNWDKLAEFKFLNIFFVNPFSTMDKRWIIYPNTHDKICDKSSLGKGLKSMFDMVDPISEEEITKIR